MFSCLAIYVEDKIVFILRDKRHQTADNGVWLATTEEHHQSRIGKVPGQRARSAAKKAAKVSKHAKTTKKAAKGRARS
jgi:hypothetical protein